MTNARLRLVLLLGLVLSARAFTIDTPLRDRSGLREPKSERMMRVRTARVVVADYALIRRDFPELRRLSNADIDRWLLEHTAYVSVPQAAQSEVNSRIDVEATATREGWRPAEYGRGIVYEVPGGLVDAKGTGALKPHQDGHGTGLGTTGEFLREYMYQKAAEQALAHSGIAGGTVGCYAVIDWGFDVQHGDGSRTPAGMLLRQGHTRSTSFCSLLPTPRGLELELVLRHYGLTSAGGYRDRPEELLNVQGTREGAIVDFGAFLSVKKFTKGIRSHGFSSTGARVVATAEEIAGVQPIEGLVVPPELWTGGTREDPRYDRPWNDAHEIAREYAAGRVGRAEIEAFLARRLEDFERRLASAPRPPAPPTIASTRCASGMNKLGLDPSLMNNKPNFGK